MEGGERGRPPRNAAESFPQFIRDTILERNKQCKPMTAKLMCSEVLKQKLIQISARTMRRILRRMGMRYIREETRNILAESEGTVAFRATYLDKKLSNIDAYDNPSLPEVFLGESHCNLHHVSTESWVDVDKRRYQKRGRGNRYENCWFILLYCSNM